MRSWAMVLQPLRMLTWLDSTIQIVTQVFFGNTIFQTLATPSAPALTNTPSLPPSSHATALTPPDPLASLIMTFLIGFATLHTHTFVSREPDAQFSEFAVHASELTREVCAPQCAVIDMRVEALYRTILPLVSPAAIILPSGEKASTEMGAVLSSRAPISVNVCPAHLYRYVLLFWYAAAV